MSKNIKEIGKELLGKSLNSFHRKTGLTQLEKNNEIQDGILDGILSQVDDAYIEKTEQSNVIHLDGSGDGVVVLDGIEGNTLVNLLNFNDIRKGGKNYNCLSINSDNKSLSLNSNLEFNNRYQYFRVSNITLHSNKEYTFVCNITKNTFSKTFEIVPYSSRHTNKKGTNGAGSHYLKVGQTGIHKYTFTMVENDIFNIMYADSNAHFNSGEVEIINPMILEGDWSDKEIPTSYSEGLQSSFEEQVEEDKYKIEILMNNKNLLDTSKYIISQTNGSIGAISNNILTLGQVASSGMYCEYRSEFIKAKEETVYSLSSHITEKNGANANHIMRYYDSNKNQIGYSDGIDGGVGSYTRRFTTIKGTKYIKFCIGSHIPTLDDTLKSCKVDLSRVMLKIGDIDTNVVPYKSNKIKLLINEPLRGLEGNIKDKLLIKDNKLVIERNCNIYKLNSRDIIGYGVPSDSAKTVRFGVYWGSKNDNKFNLDASFTFRSICNILPYNSMWSKDEVGFYCDGWNSSSDDALRQIVFRLDKNIVGSTLNSLKDWIDNNEVIVVYKTLKPIYEEVLNEYGEPIILEGYENGTLYIDSTVIPTTTVRYTPKMESFKTLKEVNKNNNLITLDINENIIPYMMDVDYMIMEKELCLLNTKNIRKMEELDMTSMQKRTQDMLERLIKGKTLTEQECKTRVTTYLNAGKITDEQAEELMLVISEIYN